ncbi:MAG: hypothetical protein OXB86_02435 [Bdellovibrionales bacterium]|nr:hypothetical protein [Bdellovibrionales bacterium]
MFKENKPLPKNRGFKSSALRFATERLSVASVSSPNSFLTPLFFGREVNISSFEKSENSNMIDIVYLNPDAGNSDLSSRIL